MVQSNDNLGKWCRVVLFIVGIFSFSIITSVKVFAYETAWFPAPRVYLSQIAYEYWTGVGENTGASHGQCNAIDISPGGNVFAPFTGVVKQTAPNWGYVLLQSTDKVYFADGTLDYMTVGFMHDSDISNISVGQKITQGTDFYQAGGMGNGKSDAYYPHVDISVFKGKVDSVTSFGRGDYYAFNSFVVNTNRTSIVYPGKMESRNAVNNGAPTDYTGLWRTSVAPIDTTKPTIVSVDVNNITSTNYTVSLIATDDVGMQCVRMPSWAVGSSSEGIAWPTAAQNDNTFKYTVTRTAGKYWVTDIYAYDSSGNSSTVRVLVRDCLVTFNPNGGWVNENSRKVYSALINNKEQNKYGSLPTPTRDGYTFEGWYSEKDGGEKITDYSNVSHVDSKTLYARWKAVTYSVSYNANGGTNAPGADSVIPGTTVTLSSKEPTRSGYKFLGWAVSTETATVEYHPGDSLAPASDLTLYAVWEELNYSGWTEEYPIGLSDSLVETKTQYRYSDYKQTNSTGLSLEGWTNTGKATTVYGEYGAWSSWSTDAVTKTDTHDVETTTLYRYYFFYCPVCGRHEPFQGTSDCGKYSLSLNDSHVGWFTTPYNKSSYRSFSYTTSKYYTNSLGDGQDWCFSAGNLNSSAIGTKDTGSDAVVIATGYRYRTRSATTVNIFERWTDWTDWSDTVATASANRKVETRVLYRYVYPTENILVLPSNLKSIESDAFASVAAEAVIVPGTVTKISDRAIDTTFIIGKPGTAAEEYANENGITFIDINDYY